MFSWQILRKSQQSRLINANQRLKRALNKSEFTTSSASTKSRNNGDENHKSGGDALLNLLLRSFGPGAVIVGSGLGLFAYWNSYDNNDQYFLTFADCPKDTSWVPNDDDLLLAPEKNGRFLFGGICFIF